MFNIMSYNKINLRFTDDFCEYNNKVSSNNFDDKYQASYTFNKLK